ncbi:MAG: hypothetical protein NTV94_15675 [Planctomycetota bacterium]|nr:hypothetical protein [Planctomycetota bacterium]
MKQLSMCALVALMAGASAQAMAQEMIPFTPGMSIQRLEWNDGVVTPVGEAGGYDSRAPETYNSNTAQCFIFITGLSNIIDDVNFGPVGPWATTTNNVIRSIKVPLGNSGTTVLSYDFKVTLWDTANFAASPMIATTATPLWTATYAVRNLAQGGYELNFNIAAGVTAPDNQVYVQLEFYQPGSTTLLMSTAAGRPGMFYTANRTTTGPGSSTAEFGLDINNNRVFAGGALGTTERRTLTFAATDATCPSQPMNLPIVITGDIPITPPANPVALGTLVDAATPRTDALAAGAVKWYTFNLSGDITDAAMTFLDIDTEGSTINTSMALFRPNGNRIASDERGGSGELSQLSFGIGRRNANGDGEQFDGYDGQLFATDGPFYLAVCEGTATFSDGFVATPAAPATAGNIRLRVRSNIVSNTLAASVAPIGTDLGQILSPGVPTVATLPGAFGVVWHRFNICRDIDGSSTDNYFDIDYGNGEGAADPVAYIFNESGNVVFASDDTDANIAFPIFSFGNAGPRGPYTVGGAIYTGQTGPFFPAGNYWLATGLFQLNALPEAATAGRWHLRALSGNNLNVRADLYTGVAECGSACSPCAADYNVDGGIDGSDIGAFLPDWENTAPCADVNQDGGVDGGDIEAFFRVWEAGTC